MFVKNSIEKIIDGGDVAKILSEEHSDWFRELFSSSVTSGILKASDLETIKDSNGKPLRSYDPAFMNTICCVIYLK